MALILIFAGLAFRLTAVPFHFYAPDVYQGTSNPNAGLLAVVPKIAGLVVLVRICVCRHARARASGVADVAFGGHRHDDTGQLAGLVAG